MNKRQKSFNILTFFSYVFLLLSLIFLLSLVWLNSKFSGISFEAIIFHIKIFGTLKATGGNYIKSYINSAILPIVFFGILIIIFKLLINYFKISISNSRKTWEFDLNHLFVRINDLPVSRISLIVFLININILIYNFELDEYIIKYFQRTNIYDLEYIDPNNVKFIFPLKKRNLILIFMESIESSFFRIEDGGIMYEDIMPELRELSLGNIHFSNNSFLGGAKQVFGTGWTIAGIVAHILGIPLILPFYGNAYDSETYETFLPGAIGLTDILAKAGYEQRFLIGSDKKFAGRDIFFRIHGNVQIKDLLYYKYNGKIPDNYHVYWGFEDEKLYEFAKEELTILSSLQKPFNLILLTVDTHHPNGYVCRLCKKDFDSQYKNVLSCASRQVVNFIKWVQSQPWYENTTIVILGDHLFMSEKFVPDNFDRRIFNVFINAARKPIKTKNREFTSFDIFPSIIDSLGIHYEGPGLGLGRSLFKETKTLLEKYGFIILNSELRKKSERYDRFFIQ